MCTGERIKERRIASGLSVTELAQLIGKDRATLYRYENGSIDDIPVSTLTRIADVLRTSPTYLIGWDNDLPSSGIEINAEEQRFLTALRNANPIYKDVALKILEDNPLHKEEKQMA